MKQSETAMSLAAFDRALSFANSSGYFIKKKDEVNLASVSSRKSKFCKVLREKQREKWVKVKQPLLAFDRTAGLTFSDSFEKD